MTEPMHENMPKASRRDRRQPRHVAFEQSTPLTLLLADTDGPAPPASRLAVLTTDTQAPEVTQTSVGADLLQSLEIITELAVDTVGENLVVLAVDNVTLSVEEPAGNFVLGRVLDDRDNAFELFRSKFASAVNTLRNQYWFLHN